MSRTFPLTPEGIEATFLWADRHIVEVRVEATGARFVAAVDVYASRDQLIRAVKAIEGFPSTPSEVRSIELGEAKADRVGGSVRLEFRRVDGAGHGGAFGRFRSRDRQSATNEFETAAFFISIEPAQIDRLVVQLRSILASAAEHLD